MRRAVVVLLLLIANALFGSNKSKTAPEVHPATSLAQASSLQSPFPCEPEASTRL